MSAKIFDGKRMSSRMLLDLARRVKKLGFTPKLVSFYKPDDPGSALYTRIKEQKAREVGIEFEAIEIFRVTDVVGKIREMGEMEGVTGILVQHPSGEFSFHPDHWEALVGAIPPQKDVDGLRDYSLFIPATVRAIMVAMDQAGVKISGCKIAVVGSKGMVGSRLVSVLKEKDARVSEIDNTTTDIWFQTKSSDVVVSCAGVSKLISGEMIKKGAVVIDVGAPGGDVDFQSVVNRASFVTPVPGGIGPLTVACLLANVVLAAENE